MIRLPAQTSYQLRRRTLDRDIASCPPRPRCPLAQVLSPNFQVPSWPEIGLLQQVPGPTGAHRKLTPPICLRPISVSCSFTWALQWSFLSLILFVAVTPSSSVNSTGKDTKTSSMSDTKSIRVRTATVCSGGPTHSTSITRHATIAKRVPMPTRSSNTHGRSVLGLVVSALRSSLPWTGISTTSASTTKQVGPRHTGTTQMSCMGSFIRLESTRHGRI